MHGVVPQFFRHPPPLLPPVAHFVTVTRGVVAMTLIAFFIPAVGVLVQVAREATRADWLEAIPGIGLLLSLSIMPIDLSDQPCRGVPGKGGDAARLEREQGRCDYGLSKPGRAG
jgi:hypothetical protein